MTTATTVQKTLPPGTTPILKSSARSLNDSSAPCGFAQDEPSRFENPATSICARLRERASLSPATRMARSARSTTCAGIVELAFVLRLRERSPAASSVHITDGTTDGWQVDRRAAHGAGRLSPRRVSTALAESRRVGRVYFSHLDQMHCLSPRNLQICPPSLLRGACRTCAYTKECRTTCGQTGN